MILYGVFYYIYSVKSWGPALRSGGSGRLWWLSWEILALAKSASAPGPNFSPAPFAEALLGRSTKDSRPFVMWRPAGMFISKVYCSVQSILPFRIFLRYSRRLKVSKHNQPEFSPSTEKLLKTCDPTTFPTCHVALTLIGRGIRNLKIALFQRLY